MTTELDLQEIRERAEEKLPPAMQKSLLTAQFEKLQDDVLALLDAYEENEHYCRQIGHGVVPKGDYMELVAERDRLTAQIAESKLIASTLHTRCCDLQDENAKLMREVEAFRDSWGVIRPRFKGDDVSELVKRLRKHRDVLLAAWRHPTDGSVLCDEAADALEWQERVIKACEERIAKQAPDQVELRELLKSNEAKLQIAVEALEWVKSLDAVDYEDCAVVREALARIKG